MHPDSVRAIEARLARKISRRNEARIVLLIVLILIVGAIGAAIAFCVRSQ